MEDKIALHIGSRLGIPHLVELLAGELTGSELNSLLLAVYEKRVGVIRPPMRTDAVACNLPGRRNFEEIK
ncbi:MAG TPA: hypothetical protein VGM31_20510 [Puia sp.]|jgi:hypothetical protein